MKKSEFVAQVAQDAGVTQVNAEKVVNAALDLIMKTLKSGDKVTLTGFGTFEVRQRAARMGMNIRTRQKIKIPASKRPAFSAGAVLRASITGKTAAKKKVAPKKPAAKPARKK
jgi:DNA-binding protein HU-beta